MNGLLKKGVLVVAQLFSDRYAFFAKPTDKTQDNGYRLGLASIRAEPLRTSAQKLFLFNMLIRSIRGVSPPTQRASTLAKTQVSNQKQNHKKERYIF
ncbi:hypothetical protein CN285_24045 [Bacillus cereus]|uniref:hypothetical protein n=1 Tax=Bacillus paramycoides TaxID=2026194 RepID=UPI000BF96D29|nr:hypothetical protein [Bacillus paramycoides]PFD35305.1 hypothetical protein CN285_24045 [Bacillus cereus]